MAATAEAPPRAIVDLVAVGRTFGAEAPVIALRDVDLEVRRGEWLAIVGASGSGKTTLLNIVGCLDRPTDGRYRFDGVDVADLGDRERAALRSHEIGFVFQAFHLLSYRSVVENVMLAEVYRRRDRAGRRSRALDALDAVGLEGRAGSLPTLLSGGQRQRVSIARALVNRPRLLLCDEPTGNLDSLSARGILDLISELHDDGLTIMMITHDADVASYAERKVTIADGRVVA